MQQKLSHCRDECSLRAGTFRLAVWAVTTGIVPVSSDRHPCLLRDAQAGKPARQFRLEAEVTSWLKKPGVSNSMK